MYKRGCSRWLPLTMWGNIVCRERQGWSRGNSCSGICFFWSWCPVSPFLLPFPCLGCCILLWDIPNILVINSHVSFGWFKLCLLLATQIFLTQVVRCVMTWILWKSSLRWSLDWGSACVKWRKDKRQRGGQRKEARLHRGGWDPGHTGQELWRKCYSGVSRLGSRWSGHCSLGVRCHWRPATLGGHHPMSGSSF